MAALPDKLQPGCKKSLKRRFRTVFLESASTSQERPTTDESDPIVSNRRVVIKKARKSETPSPIVSEERAETPEAAANVNRNEEAKPDYENPDQPSASADFRSSVLRQYQQNLIVDAGEESEIEDFQRDSSLPPEPTDWITPTTSFDTGGDSENEEQNEVVVDETEVGTSGSGIFLKRDYRSSSSTSDDDDEEDISDVSKDYTFRSDSASEVISGDILPPPDESPMDLVRGQLQAFMDAAYEQICAVYDSIPDELLHQFHEKTMAAATALQEKYLAMEALENNDVTEADKVEV